MSEQRSLRRAAKYVARQTIGRLPRSAARLSGRLAIDGGTPVRNLRYRPWPASPNNTVTQWRSSISGEFRKVFLSGREGLPQTKQKEFAAQWAVYCGCKYGLLLPHGTDALRLGLAAAFDHDGLDYGGEVVVPNLSFIASATAALDRRFGIVFVDVDPGTLNIDPARVEEAIVPGKTRAIMPVHQFGQPADMTRISDIARRHQLIVIEDAAQAHGAAWESGPVGSLGLAAGFSFQSAKNLASGEGGILTTNDEQLFDRAYSMHNTGRVRGHEGRWEHHSLGWNCRPTEYAAVLLLDRLSRFDEQQSRRAQNFDLLRRLLAESACLRPLDVHPGVRRHGMYMFVVRYRPERCGGMPVERFIETIGAEGAPFVQCYVSTLSNQLAMQKLAERRPNYVRIMPTPVADQVVTEILYLSANVFLGDAGDMEDIAAAVLKVERHATRS